MLTPLRNEKLPDCLGFAKGDGAMSSCRSRASRVSSGVVGEGREAQAPTQKSKN